MEWNENRIAKLHKVVHTSCLIGIVAQISFNDVLHYFQVVALSMGLMCDFLPFASSEDEIFSRYSVADNYCCD